MSYARWGYESDVYIFADTTTGGFTCQLCRLAPNDLGDTETNTLAEMLEHVKAHQAAGHLVPARTVARMEVELAAGAFVNALAEGKVCPHCGGELKGKRKAGRCVYAEPCGHRIGQVGS